MRAVLDTNILVDYLQGSERARAEIALYDEPGISLITWMEILIGARAAEEEPALREFLGQFQIHPLTQDVAERAVELRRHHRVRLPDALIWATAAARDAILVTRNTRDFPERNPGIRIPYRV
jgi:hypothetical protein